LESGTFLEQLMRYGSRLQNEKDNSQQSLFGDSINAIAVQKPLLPVAPEWSQLETLNKEREAIGIFLSSHPLDKYATVIRHMCNSSLEDLHDISGKNGRDFTIAGMVTGVQNLVSQKGKPYGRIKLEDYEGNTHEFTLFDKDYEKYRIFFYTDYFLFVRGKIQPHIFRQGEMEAKIGSIMQLDDVEKTILKELCVTVPVENIDESFTSSLNETLKNSAGDLRLSFNVIDRAGGVSVRMNSRRHKVGLSGGITEFLDDNELRYSIA
jgi:DNA polymerase-3 subunit alpha